MGTSQSSLGPGGNTSLVPPWADDEPEKPLPSPSLARFKPFRQSLGRFVNTNNSSDLKSALRSYARKGTGGGSIASRRLGSVTTAGSNLYELLHSFSESREPTDISIDFEKINGQSCDIAIDVITDSLATQDGDTAKIHAAMNHALVEALDGIELFDPTQITDEIIVATMINYLSEAVFLQIVMDAGKAWTKAETPTLAMTAENSLREFIKVLVDKHLAPKLQEKRKSLSKQEFKSVQREVIQIVWKEWEEYQ